MKTFTRKITLLMTLVALLLGAASCMKKGASSKPSNVDYYTCTMHPFVRSQDPKGKCPICGMDLVPVLKSSTNNSTTNAAGGTTNAAPVAATSPVDQSGMVNITPERMQEIGVNTEVVAKHS